MTSGSDLFERVVRSPDALWAYWLEHASVVDPDQSGVVVAMGRPEREHLARARREAEGAGWGGLLADYWAFLERHDGVALDQGGDGEPRVAIVAPETLWEPVLWPARAAAHSQLADYDVPFAALTLCFGELVGSGYLFFRRSRAGLLRRRVVDVWFFDVQERDATRLASSFDELLLRLSACALRLDALLDVSGAKGWRGESPPPPFVPPP